MAKAAKKKTKKKLSPDEIKARKLQGEHRNFARSIFRRAGFMRLGAATEKEFTYKEITSEFDDIFLSENILVVCEYTTSDESKVAIHLKKKSFLYTKIVAEASDFVHFVKINFPDTAAAFSPKYADCNTKFG